MRAIIYARCSTDEKRQDVELQLRQLREYCDRQGWKHDELWEYVSASKSVPPKLRKAVKLIEDKVYDVFIVYDLSRFSRLHPKKTSDIMEYISSKCRFLSLQDGIDSYDEIKWLVIRPLFQYMAYIYSKNLSEKVKEGMKRAKEKGKQIGRPKGSTDKKRRSKKGYFKRYEEKNPIFR